MEVTGTLGLGSKSPLSLVDSFTVNSFFNQEKRTYIVEFGEDGIPKINAVGVPIETTEKNGLEIQFPVKTSEIYEFERAANDVLKYFEIKPRINLSDKLTYDIIEKGSCWELTNYGNFRVVMGNVCYPINQEKMSRHLAIADTFIFKMPIIVKLKNKEVDFVPSRESLAYTKRTVEVMKNYIELIHKEILEKIQAAIDACANTVDAKIKLIELASHYKISSLTLEYKGRKIDCERYYSFPSGVEVRKVYSKYSYKVNGEVVKTHRVYTLNFQQKATLVEKNVNAGHIRTLNEHLSKNSNDNIYIVEFQDPSKKKELLDGLCLDSIPLFTDVFQLIKAPNGKRTLNKVGNAIRYSLNRYLKDNINLDLTKTSGVFVPYINNEIRFEFNGVKHVIALYTLNTILHHLRCISQLNEIYLVNSLNIKSFEASKNWTTFSKYLENIFNKYKNIKGIGSEFKNLSYTKSWNLFKNRDIQDKMMVDFINNQSEVTEINLQLKNLRDYFNIKAENYVDLSKIEIELFKKYPLLAVIMTRTYNTLDKSYVDELVYYINSKNPGV
jgi:hypothetical protein